MTIPVTALAILVSTAMVITMLAPLVLVVLWIRDWLKGDLW